MMRRLGGPPSAEVSPQRLSIPRLERVGNRSRDGADPNPSSHGVTSFSTSLEIPNNGSNSSQPVESDRVLSGSGIPQPNSSFLHVVPYTTVTTEGDQTGERPPGTSDPNFSLGDLDGTLIRVSTPSASLDSNSTTTIASPSHQGSPQRECTISTSSNSVPQDMDEISNVKSLSIAPQDTSEFSSPSSCTIRGRKSGRESSQADSSSSPGCGLICPSSSPGSFPAGAALNHPWAHLVRPRSLRLQDLQPEQVTADLPDDLYRQIPLSGYLSAKFCRSLFPRETLPNGVVPENISCIELPSLEDAVLFREAADTLIQFAFERALQPLPRPPRDKLSPKGIWSPRLLPQEHLGRRPVLYQVVALISNALVLEAKDFFVFLPDHRELHCILLDKFALNLESGSYGFDRGVVSIRDLVWVYELIPVAAVLNDPQAELKRARIPRMTALDPQVGFFFRVRTYAFVTPAVISEPRYAIVMSVITHRNAVSNVRMALEGTTESVVVPTSLIHFDADLIREGDVLKAITRRKISCAVRFSEPPISDEARDVLCQYARLFFPANPSDALLPMEVHQLPQEEKSWINDRLANFDNYYRDKANAIVTMFRVFNVAASTLAAYVHLDDDHNLHRLEATIPDLADHPLQLTFSLYNMTSDGGWRPHRWIGVWVPDAQSFFRFQVDSVIPGPNIHQLQISSRALPYSDGAIRRVVRTVGRVDDENNSATLDVYLQLFRVTTCALPAYEAVSEAGLLRTVPEDSLGRQILDKVYGAAPLTVAPEPDKDSSASDFADGYSITYHGHELVLTEEQRQALTLGLSNFSIVGIQGAFGTGKTIIGACVASLLVHRGHRVIVTASTNAAVAHITETILGLSFAAGVKMCRFVAETILFDDSVPRTPADMNEVLKTFADRFRDVLPKNISKQCQRFREGRNLIDDHHRNRASGGRILSAFEREELLLAERDVSDLIEQMASVMFKWYRPNIIVITTSSFLNATSKNGIFRGYLDEFDVLLCDEASQLPEPVFAAMLTRLPHARQIHIGDVHQLEPHVRCSRTSTAALLGARSVIDVLSQARAVPMVSLNTTFRAHPNLNELSNQIVSGGTVLSGTTSDAHRLLLDVVSFPNDSLPFIFIDVEGASQRSSIALQRI